MYARINTELLVIDPTSRGPRPRVTGLSASPGGGGAVVVRRPTASAVARDVGLAVGEMVRASELEMLRQFAELSGTWRLHLASDGLILSESAGARLGIAPDGAPTLADLADRTEPADRSRLLASIARCVMRDLPLDVAVRLRPQGGLPGRRARLRGRVFASPSRMLLGNVVEAE